MDYENRRIAKSTKILSAILSNIIFTKKSKDQLDISKCKSIVIVYSHLLGDIVMLIPFIRALKTIAPEAQISLVAPWWAEEILSSQKLIDKFYDFGNTNGLCGGRSVVKNKVEIFNTLKEMREERFEIAIEPLGNIWSALFMRLLKSKKYIGMDFAKMSYLFSDVFKYSSNVHLVDIMLNLLKQMEYSIKNDYQLPELTLNGSDQKKNEKFIAESNLKGKIILGIHPGASQENRRWNGYGELLNKLSSKYKDIVFLLFEGPSEKKIVDELEGYIKLKKVNYLRIKVKLRDYIRLLNICDHIVCNDSSCGHFSAALDVPVTIIYGQGNPRFVAPRSKSIVNCISKELECKSCGQNICPKGTLECIAWVTSDIVFKYVDESLWRIKNVKKC